MHYDGVAHRNRLAGGLVSSPRTYATFGLLLAGLFASTWASPGLCLETGRTWSPMDVARIPGYLQLVPSRLDLGRDGRPMVYLSARGGLPNSQHVLGWNDSVWVSIGQLGYETAFLQPVVSMGARDRLLWQTYDELYLPVPPYFGTYLVTGEFSEGQYEATDTVAIVAAADWAYSGAITDKREWILKSDYVGIGSSAVRGWTREPEGDWDEFRLPGTGLKGVSVAPVNDTTAIAVWVDLGGPLRWAWLHGIAWVDGGTIPGALAGYPLGPHFRRSPSGRLWLVWSTDEDFLQMASFAGGAWAAPETLRCTKLVPGTYASKESRPSRDNWERPVVAWVEHDTRRGYLGTVCLSVPTATGYSSENLPGTSGAIYAEALRDSLGDVWLIWTTWGDGVLWQHSHVSAVARQVAIEGRGNRQALVWSLDEPAPGSWWTILRSRGEGAFEAVGRVQAGDGLDLSWPLNEGPSSMGRGGVRLGVQDVGRLSFAPRRYKVQRECLDANYRWESEEVAWPPQLAVHPPQVPRPRLKPVQSPWGPHAALEVEDAAAGRLEVALFDLQGRRVLTRFLESPRDGHAEFSLEPSEHPLAAGVYFARVRDAEGRWSDAVRTVVLR